MNPTARGAPPPREGAVLDRRTLNRTLLQRQLLLGRAGITAAGALEHLVGMQAQAAQDPYTGLWSRVAGFRAEELSRLIADREAVRTGLMRWTIHLVTAEDCLALRPVLQPVIEQRLSGTFRRQLEGLDLDEVASAARDLLGQEPLTTGGLGERLRERWPERDRLALGAAAAARVPLVQVPPRGLWRRSGAARHVPAASWLAGRHSPRTTRADTVLRYLAAFGPASAADIGVWSGMTRVRALLEGAGERLVVYRDERGTELYDVPGAPFPDPEVPAPPRFLPQYDNLLLSHQDRSRVFRTEEDRERVKLTGRERRGTYLVDGFVHGTWQFEEGGKEQVASLTVEPFGAFGQRGEREEVAAEAAELLRFLADAETDAPVGTEFGARAEEEPTDRGRSSGERGGARARVRTVARDGRRIRTDAPTAQGAAGASDAVRVALRRTGGGGDQKTLTP